MSAQIDVPKYTYLKRGVYYFVIVAFITVGLGGCQTITPKSNSMTETEFTEFLKISTPSSTHKPLIDMLPRPGKVAVDAAERKDYVDGKNICASTDLDRTVTVLAGVSAPEDYGLDDRYRGVFGTRKVVLMNEADVEKHDLDVDWPVTLYNTHGDKKRDVLGLKIVIYEIPKGCIATYFPECNVLIPLESKARKSNTPASKSIKVRLFQ